MASNDILGSFSNKRAKRRWWRILVALLLVCALVVALLVAADYWTNYGKIYRGVSAGGVDLGGKTPEEARNILEEQTGGLKEIKLTGPEEFTIPSKDVDVNFDVQATVDRAYAVGRQGDVLKRIDEGIKGTWGTISVPFVVSYDREQLRSGLSDVFKELTVKPVEAGFEVNGADVSVTQSQTGQHVDEEKLLDDMEAGLPQAKSEYEVPVVTDEPTLTTEEAEQLKPTSRLGKYRTQYTLSSDKSPERVENLAIGSNAINDTFVAPGEVFSMNKVVSGLPYNKTDVIIDGKEDKADGGGLCQVTSTLYMAANYAGLEILERHPHATQLPYIRPGLDATVWFGNGNGDDALDMKFKNDTDGYLLLRESVSDDGYIYAEVWGQPTGEEIEMDSEPTYLGADYSKWVTYKKVTEDGKVTFDDVFHKDTYQPYVDEKGKVFPPNSKEVTVAPVNP
jgi:vancomycin resistance protein YoaR